MSRLSAVLDTYLSARGVVHGVLLDILGLGVLVIGESGIGKSECALDLVVRGHRLVADDAVELRCRAQSFVLGQLPGADPAPHGDSRPRDHQRPGHVRHRLDPHLEARRAGGAAGTLGARTRVRSARRRRLASTSCSGIRIPMVRMPVAPGRNVAILVEVAARNQLLRASGHHAARRLVDRVNRGLELATIDSDDGARAGRGPVDAREAARRAPRGARTAVDVAVRRPHRRVGLGKIAGDPRARGSRLLLRRQPAGDAAADARRADAAGRQRDRARRGRRRRARRQAADRVPGDLPQAEDDAQPEPGADLPRGVRAGAGAALQRDAAAAPAGAGPLGHRRHPRGAQGDARASAAWPITSSTRRA